MATKSIVDTHALIWHLEGSSKLGQQAKAILDSPTSELILPTIALAEAVFVVGKGKTSLLSVADLISDVTNDPRIEIYPLTFEVLRESLQLSAIPEIHDRLIVATGLHLQSSGDKVEILTKDNEIVLASVLPVVWK